MKGFWGVVRCFVRVERRENGFRGRESCIYMIFFCVEHGVYGSSLGKDSIGWALVNVELIFLSFLSFYSNCHHQKNGKPYIGAKTEIYSIHLTPPVQVLIESVYPPINTMIPVTRVMIRSMFNKRF